MKLNLARNRSLASGLPNMANTLTGWEQTITLGKVVQTIDQGDLVETIKNITFKGVVQPLSTAQLALQPEGQRDWEHLWIHCKAGDLNLNTADKIVYNNKRYKIIGLKDYSAYGFIEYMAIEDFKDE